MAHKAMSRRWIIAILLVMGAAGPPSGGYAQAPYNRTTAEPEFQREVESQLITQRLSALGLGPSDVQARLDGLTDEQIHQLARNLDATASAGGSLLALIGLVAVLALVLVAHRASRPAHGFGRGFG